MKLTFKLFLFFTVLFGCKTKSKTFDSFVFSYNDLANDYSIKFTKNDTVYLQQRFPKPVHTFYSVIKPDNRKTLDSLLDNVDFSDLKHEYIQENLDDGGSYNFFLIKNKTVNNVFVYGDNGPQNLYDFAKCINNIKQSQKFVATNNKINFGNLSKILLPSVNAPQ